MIYTPLAECSRVDVCAVSAEFPPTRVISAVRISRVRAQAQTRVMAERETPSPLVEGSARSSLNPASEAEPPP
jgi:hypothetical protein